MLFLDTGTTRSFNSRTREDATSLPESLSPEGKVSIHAPVRMRPASSAKPKNGYSFNSRTREDATRGGGGGVLLWIVSIHAPVRMRLTKKRKKLPLRQFQFTHP